jgi:hypothetical protein
MSEETEWLLTQFAQAAVPLTISELRGGPETKRLSLSIPYQLVAAGKAISAKFTPRWHKPDDTSPVSS